VTAERLRREFDASIEWLPYDLHPEYPPEGIPREELHRKYGFDHDPMVAEFARRGLAYAPPPETVPNTRDALRLTELARDRGVHAAFHDRLMDAYWTEEANLAEADVLRRLAAEVGLDEADVEATLHDPDAYLARVLEGTRQAQSIGVTGIPAFLLDRRLLVLGAQPFEVFEQAFRQLAEGR
jgi:predicted DsbA family dithiol-disulfide isomerase